MPRLPPRRVMETVETQTVRRIIIPEVILKIILPEAPTILPEEPLMPPAQHNDTTEEIILS